MRVGLVGLGGMGKVVANELLQQPDSSLQVCGAIVAREDFDEVKAQLQLDIPLLSSIEELMQAKPGIVAEVAGHGAVNEFAEMILASGTDLLVISTGALANDALYQRLQDAARSSGSRLLLPAGAVGGIDALGAARLAGIDSVTYRARKPAMAWSGTSAEDNLDLASLQQATCFYRGSAREAALAYPKNSNVAATVALAGVGFDETRVELVADPHTSENTHEIEVTAKSGSFRIELAGKPLPESPKTSALAAYSVARCLLGLEQPIVI